MEYLNLPYSKQILEVISVNSGDFDYTEEYIKENPLDGNIVMNLGAYIEVLEPEDLNFQDQGGYSKGYGYGDYWDSSY